MEWAWALGVHPGERMTARIWEEWQCHDPTIWGGSGLGSKEAAPKERGGPERAGIAGPVGRDPNSVRS